MIFVIFGISFAICAGMIATRIFEIKKEKAFFFTEFLNKVDVVADKKFVVYKAGVMKGKKEAVFFVTHYVPFYVWNKARDLTAGLRKKYDKIERTVRGRDMIKQTGEASQFMKNISDYKNTTPLQTEAKDVFITDTPEEAKEEKPEKTAE